MSDPHTPDAPAPWQLKGRGWIFLLSGLGKTTSFPAGWADPTEAEVLAAGGEFIGGPGNIQVISYSESPVGPYDELIYAPGRWKYADGSKGFRITHIYVSTKASTLNGRRNWNIPKHVADFSIKQDPQTSVWHLSVSHPESPAPFFKVSVHPIRILSSLSIPFISTITGNYLGLVQPPLPAGPLPEEVATKEWYTLTPLIKGKVHLASVTSDINGKVGDGVGFPSLVPSTSIAMSIEGDLEFGVPTVKEFS